MNDHGKTMLGWGFAAAALGGLAMLDSASVETACTSILVRSVALSKCQNADLEWTGGIIGLILGIGLIIAGAIMRSRRDQS